MKLTNLVTGGTFECDDTLGERLLAEGGYEKVGAAPEPVKAVPAKKAAPRKAAPSDR